MTERPAAVVAAIAMIAVIAAIAPALGCRAEPRRLRKVTVDDEAIKAVNALVPEALKQQLVFERRELVIERGAQRVTYALAAPAGWAQTSKSVAHLRPEGATARLPRLEVGSNCDGECVPKPWAAIADPINFAPRRTGTVLKDELVPGRRTMIAEVDSSSGKSIDVVIGWWAEGDRRYHTCIASLDDSLRKAVPAFEQACLVVAIDEQSKSGGRPIDGDD